MRYSLTHERLKELLDYSPETGKFTWRVNRRVAKIGDEAGQLNHYGYYVIYLDGFKYPAQRLAWFYVHEEWPEKGRVVDHINRVPTDNRISNLRVVTHQLNQLNRGDKTKGCWYDPVRGLWAAGIKKDYKKVFLGRYKTEEEARNAYLRAKESFTEDLLNRR